MSREVLEDYIKAIFEIAEKSAGLVQTNALAERMGVAAASATSMIKRLSQMKLVHYARYQGVELTAAGEKLAIEIVRHHRLVESYLAEALGVPWDQVHEEAEKWEHVLSEDLEQRMDAALGFPTHDPHGAPIPTPELELERRKLVDLGSQVVGWCGPVREVSDHSSELLRYLGERGLYPNTMVTVTEKEPFGGSLVVALDGGRTVQVGLEAAQAVYVDPIE